MEVQLKEIITKLKNEGVEEAQRQAQKIIDDAQAKAQDILNEAEQQAKRVRRHAEEDAKRFEQSGTESVRHAGRDLILLVKKNIEDLLAQVLQQKVGEAFNDQQLGDCIASVVSQWQPEGEIVVELPPNQASKLEASLVKKLQQTARHEQIVIRPFPELSAGFRVTTQQGAIVYDFSQQEVTQALSHLLNPRFAELLK